MNTYHKKTKYNVMIEEGESTNNTDITEEYDTVSYILADGTMVLAGQYINNEDKYILFEVEGVQLANKFCKSMEQTLTKQGKKVRISKMEVIL